MSYIIEYSSTACYTRRIIIGKKSISISTSLIRGMWKLKAQVGALYLETVLVGAFSKCCEQLILMNIDVKIEDLYN